MEWCSNPGQRQCLEAGKKGWSGTDHPAVVNFISHIGSSMSAQTQIEKIVILGGGMGSLGTAFELTSQPGWQERYDITIYQLGWRLGGKGASGRSDEGRIEEHGLHIWFGF